jgi:hypothetical protein
MAKFEFGESFNAGSVITAKLSALAADTAGLAAGFLTDADVGKGVKLGASDRYVLAAAGDEIEGFIVAIEPATVDGFTLGSVALKGNKKVTFEGAGITPGTLVVLGAPIAKGVALAVPVAVKAGAAIAQSAAHPFAWNPSIHLWRVISGTGVAGTQGVIERVGGK